MTRIVGLRQGRQRASTGQAGFQAAQRNDDLPTGSGGAARRQQGAGARRQLRGAATSSRRPPSSP